MTIVIGNEKQEVNVPGLEFPYIVAINDNGDIFVYDNPPNRTDIGWEPSLLPGRYIHIASVIEFNSKPYVNNIIEIDIFDTIIDFNN